MLQDKLLQIGLSDNEAKIYLSLLKLGPQAVSIIAKKNHLNRTTTYSILQSLEKKGIVSFYRNGSMKYFVANDPNSLVGFIDRKCQEFDYYRDEILSSVSDFRQLGGNYEFDKPVVTYFDGLEGVKNVMMDSLNVEKCFRAYIPLHKWLESGKKDFIIEFKNFRIIDKKVPLKAIVPDTEEVRAFFKSYYKKDDGLTDILYVKDKSQWNMFEDQMTIYNDKVAILHLDAGEEYAIVIESEQVASMHKMIFDMTRRGLKVFNDQKDG